MGAYVTGAIAFLLAGSVNDVLGFRSPIVALVFLTLTVGLLDALAVVWRSGSTLDWFLAIADGRSVVENVASGWPARTIKEQYIAISQKFIRHDHHRTGVSGDGSLCMCTTECERRSASAKS